MFAHQVSRPLERGLILHLLQQWLKEEGSSREWLPILESIQRDALLPSTSSFVELRRLRWIKRRSLTHVPDVASEGKRFSEAIELLQPHSDVETFPSQPETQRLSMSEARNGVQ